MLNWHSFLFKKSQKQQQQKKLTKIKHNETIKKEINLKKLILTLPRTQNYPKWLEVDHAPEIHLLRFPLMTNRNDKNEIEMMVTMMISIAIIKYCACMRNVNIK